MGRGACVDASVVCVERERGGRGERGREREIVRERNLNPSYPFKTKIHSGRGSKSKSLRGREGAKVDPVKVKYILEREQTHKQESAWTHNVSTRQHTSAHINNA